MKNKKNFWEDENYLFDSYLEDLKLWNQYLEQGGSDPNYADGENMNFIRQRANGTVEQLVWVLNREKKEETREKIRGMLQEIKEKYPLPPIMPNKYVTNAEEIMKKAEGLLHEVKNSEEYAFLLSNYKTVSDKDFTDKDKIHYFLLSIEQIEKYLSEENAHKVRTKYNALSNSPELSLQKMATSLKNFLEELEERKINGYDVNTVGQLNFF